MLCCAVSRGQVWLWRRALTLTMGDEEARVGNGEETLERDGLARMRFSKVVEEQARREETLI